MIETLWRYKFSIAAQGAILAVASLSRGQTQVEHQATLQNLGMSWEILSNGQLWHLLTGTWIQSAPGIGWNMASMCLMVGLGTFPLEHQVGSARAMTTVVLADWFATTTTSATLRVMVAMGRDDLQSLLTTADSGTSAVAWGGMAATTMVLPAKHRRWAVPLLLTATAVQYAVEAPAPGIAHCWAVGFGLVAGTFLRRKGYHLKKKLAV